MLTSRGHNAQVDAHGLNENDYYGALKFDM